MPASLEHRKRMLKHLEQQEYMAMAIEAVEVGSILYDNDPRRPGRTLTIQRIDNTFAFCINGSMQTATITRAQFRNLNPGERATFMASDGVVSDDRQARIRLDRIHSDGKPRRKGFSTTAPVAPIHIPITQGAGRAP